ncbi:MAG TPA: hypothetical protein VM290_02395 [Gaiellaceae bacterium]|nr:hypothetical protein [Gaiellaceae bacterium]
MSTPTQRPTPVGGGLTVNNWLLVSEARSFVSKRDNQTRTVVELRDPSRLSSSLVLFLDGEPGPLAAVPINSRVTLRVDEVRSGRGRGELVGSVSRAAVEQAFSSARGGGS